MKPSELITKFIQQKIQSSHHPILKSLKGIFDLQSKKALLTPHKHFVRLINVLVDDPLGHVDARDG